MRPIPLSVVVYFAWQHHLSEESSATALKRLAPFVEAWAWPAQQLDALFARCQSPVERLFALGVVSIPQLETVHAAGASCSYWLSGIKVELEAQPAAVEHDGVTLHPDFALRLSGDVESALYVEIDGHEFHATTRQQVARDRQRERAIVGAGHVVIRFTGGEVNASPIACAREAIRIARAVARKEEAA